MEEMYYIYSKDGVLLETTDNPAWQNYDYKIGSFYATEEADAKALLLSGENNELYYANIEGIEEFPWLTETVTVTTNPQ